MHNETKELQRKVWWSKLVRISDVHNASFDIYSQGRLIKVDAVLMLLLCEFTVSHISNCLV